MAKFIKMDINIKEDLRTIERRMSKAIAIEFNNRIRNGLEKISRDIENLSSCLLYTSDAADE